MIEEKLKKTKEETKEKSLKVELKGEINLLSALVLGLTAKQPQPANKPASEKKRRKSIRTNLMKGKSTIVVN